MSDRTSAPHSPSPARVASPAAPASVADSPQAWMRLAISMLLSTIGGCGMYVVVVVLPSLQSEFGIDRAAASLPYTATMIGFGFGGILMGRLADRYGVMVPVTLGAICLGVGSMLAGHAGGLAAFVLAQAVLIGMLGSAATFSPLLADTSLWFDRRRGIAVALCASGNYLAGTLWPPVVQHFVETAGWRQTYVGIGVFCMATMLPLAMLLRRRPPAIAHAAPAPSSASTSEQARAATGATGPAEVPAGVRPASAGPAGRAFERPPIQERPLGMSPGALQALLALAGVACCVAMSMPQVHIVAYCGDLGYGPARGAEMLSLMLGFGIVSRIASGFIADRIGGLRTLLLGSSLQALALVLFLPFDSLASLYVVSAMFGLFQGGIVPSYALVVREHFPAQQAGSRVGLVITATLFGMALGGWLSGKIFDLTGSYDAAFVNGIAWNLVNIAIVAALIVRERRGPRMRLSPQG